jgi:RNA polymerase sigma factor (sigma-70 family)
VNYKNIISEFQADVSKGLAALFEAFGQPLYGFAVNRWNLSEDESYEVLYKTFETVGKVISRYEFTSENHFANWIFKIHKNNILQFIRAKKRKESEHQIYSYADWENEASELADEGFSVAGFNDIIEKVSVTNFYSNTPSANLLMLAMQKALQQISDLERDLLLLRMNNYSYEEIAQMLGIENNQLKVKFNRAKAKVQKKTLEILNENKL